jgi:hypothetical protein
VFYYGYSELRKFSQLINSSNILFHWRRNFRGVNLGNIPRSVLFQGIFPRKFLVHSKLFAWSVIGIRSVLDFEKMLFVPEQIMIKFFFRVFVSRVYNLCNWSHCLCVPTCTGREHIKIL